MDNIVSLNVRGLRNATKRANVFYYLRQYTASVICLQETHSSTADEKLWSAEWGSPIFYSHGTARSAGVAVLFPKNRQCQIIDLCRDEEGRYLIIEAELGDLHFVLCNLYAPNTDNPVFFTKLFEEIERFNIVDLMLIGDFNLVINAKIDRTVDTVYHPRALACLLQNMERLNLCDVWRARNASKVLYSWEKSGINGSQCGSRIDMMLCNNALISKCSEVTYNNSLYSDHMLLLVQLNCTNHPRGPGYWKFNALLLQDQDYVIQIRELLSKIVNMDMICIKKWEYMKYKVAEFTKSYSKSCAVEKKKRYQQLLFLVNELKLKLQAHPENTTIALSLANIESEMLEYITLKRQAAKFRAKARWDELGEKSNKYFLSLEKSNYNKKVLTEIITECGVLTQDPEVILVEEKKYYQKLYEADPTVNFVLVNDTGVRVRDSCVTKLRNIISVDECKQSVDSLKLCKTPGCDGLSAEFYQFFWKEIESLYMDCIYAAFDTKKLHDSALKGIISLIPKKDKDLRYIKNWRPLTMLNTDYKILATALANRIKTILDYLIAEDQTGFMAGRQISCTIRKVNDLVHLGNYTNTPGFVVNADFEKCFDTISYAGIRGSLRFFGFPEEYISCVDLLLDGFNSCVANNGHFSDFFNVDRSCHQGCPLAPYLMVLCGEAMAVQFRINEEIPPYVVRNITQKLSQHADDTQIVVADEPGVISKIVQVFQLMRDNIGLKINYEKTTVHMIGGSMIQECEVPLRWTQDPPVMLGINSGDYVKQYDQALDKAQEVLNTWSVRNVSLMGKITVINTLVASLFVYLMQALPSPGNYFFQKFDTMISAFLWGSSKAKAKIPLVLLQAKKELGGLKLVNLRARNQSLKMQWLFRKEAFFDDILATILPQGLGALFLECTMHEKWVDKFVKDCAPPFWLDVIKAWFHLQYKTLDKIADDGDINQQIIWCNAHILIDKKTNLFFALYREGFNICDTTVR